MGTGSSDDYYALLGIDAEADNAELRHAWRRLDLRPPPDRADPGAMATFQRIVAAYAVLSDRVARAAYDRWRGAPARSPEVRSGDLTSAPSGTTRRRAPSEMIFRLCRSMTALLACGVARHAEGDFIELFLDAEEAAEGGMINTSMRVPVHCPACAADAAGSCAQCGMRRTLDEIFAAWLAVPPEVADGAILTPSAWLPRMVRPVWFRVRLPGAT
ncbi:MAG TPA: DnaJ domain-containing protein [Kofleriaceae bacterium]|nr:DnaJ domain-containing protein [Kofleriaceae bacterium]